MRKEMMMNKNWEVKKLGEIAKIQLGKTPYRKDKSLWDIAKTSNNVWLSIADLKHGEYISESKEYISDLAVQNMISVPKGTMMISFKLTLGRVSFAGQNLYTNEAIASLIDINRNINKRFLFYYFSFFDWDKETEGDVKIKGKTLNKKKLSNIDVSIPPLSEQHRIVSILDQSFAAIDQAISRTQRNLNNAKEIFESYLNRVFEEKGEDWEEKKLEGITSKIGSGATPRGGQANYKTEGISMIRSMNIHDLKFEERNLAFIDDKQASNLNNVILQQYDVLINITGASIARCCVLPEEYLPARVNQHVSIIRPLRNIVDPYFLSHLLVSKAYKKKLLDIGNKGATRQAITKAEIEKFKISFPNLVKQQLIVEKLESLQVETQRLEAIYRQKLKSLKELKKSMLEMAFRGEL